MQSILLTVNQISGLHWPRKRPRRKKFQSRIQKAEKKCSARSINHTWGSEPAVAAVTAWELAAPGSWLPRPPAFGVQVSWTPVPGRSRGWDATRGRAGDFWFEVLLICRLTPQPLAELGRGICRKWLLGAKPPLRPFSPSSFHTCHPIRFYSAEHWLQKVWGSNVLKNIQACLSHVADWPVVSFHKCIYSTTFNEAPTVCQALFEGPGDSAMDKIDTDSWLHWSYSLVSDAGEIR